jgi:hypothetical protein
VVEQAPSTSSQAVGEKEPQGMYPSMYVSAAHTTAPVGPFPVTTAVQVVLFVTADGLQELVTVGAVIDVTVTTSVPTLGALSPSPP